jgi:ABC-2 type transport system ATP-binding protein
MSELAIETKNLHMTYGRGKSSVKALRSIDFKLQNGQNYCLLGPNGAGKTTLIRCILGLLKGEGEISVLGYEMPNEREKVISKIGYMPQSISLYPDLSVKESLHFFGKIFGINNRQIRDKSVKNILDLFVLKEWKNTRVDNLSGGMKRRLSLACTLIHEPMLLILDEPTVGVDPNLRLNFWEYFNDLNEKGVTIITTTHIMDEAEKSKMIGFMRSGKLIAEGTYHDLKKRVPGKRKLVIETQEETTQKSAMSIQEEYSLKTMTYNFKLEVFYNDDAILDGILSLVRTHNKITSIQTVEPSLEDTFIFFSNESNKEVI